MSFSWATRTSGSLPSLPTIYLDPMAVSPSLLFQAYCLNPPLDSCEFGPCPNIDVTGIGQQISIYITSVVFAIVLVYCPRLVRPLIYAHLGLVYSLLIATTLSVCFGLLTKNDEIFVLVIVASPASVALWCMTLVRKFPLPLQATEHPPSYSNPSTSTLPLNSEFECHAATGKERESDRARVRQEREARLLQCAAFGSLVFELVMVFVTMKMRSWAVFRQPACAQSGPGVSPVNALWAACYVKAAAWAVVGYVFWQLVCCGSREETILHEKRKDDAASCDYESGDSASKEEAGAPDEWERWRIAAEPDIITWTEVSLEGHLLTASASRMNAAVILVLQCVALPDIGLVSYQNVAVLAILLTGFVGDLLKARVLHWRSLLFIALGIVPCVFGTVLEFSCPTSADLVLAYICVMTTWRRFGTPGVRCRQVFVRRFLFIIWVIVALAGSAFAWVLYLDTYTQNSIIAARRTHRSITNLFTLPVWLLAWLSTAVWPGRRMGHPKVHANKRLHWCLTPLRSGRNICVKLIENLRLSCAAINSRAHILKAGLLIITPNVIWIQMSIASDISDSPNWTFGQLFAMLVSFVSIVSLMDVAGNVKKEVWARALNSQGIPKMSGTHSFISAVEIELPVPSTGTRRPPQAVHRHFLIRS